MLSRLITMRISAAKLLSLLAIVLLAILLKMALAPGLASGVTQKGLLRLRPGMQESEILGVLGEPLSKHHIPAPYSANGVPPWKERWSWIYGRQKFFEFGSGAEIWITMESDKLISAAAERHDLGIWWCNKKECPIVWNRHEFEKLP